MPPPPTLFREGNLVPRMGEKKEELDKIKPIDYIMGWFDKRLPTHAKSIITTPITVSDRIVILLSKTGSGKSTGFPTHLFLRFFKRYRKMLLITQPRVITAKEIPEEIVSEPSYTSQSPYEDKMEMFVNIGFQTRHFVRKPLKKGILFTTVGIVLQFLKILSDEEFISKYKFVIIDEAHDRALDVDIVMLLMKRLIMRNLKNDPPFLVIMSATIDPELYATYFGTKTIFEVGGVVNPINMHFLPYDASNIIQQSATIVRTIHTQHPEDYMQEDQTIDYQNKGEIIIFCPTIEICTLIQREVQKLNHSLEHKMIPIVLTGKSVNGVKKELYEIYASLNVLSVYSEKKFHIPVRKVIIATNVAETGLTLRNLKYCIDTGLENSVQFMSAYNTTIVAVKPATKSMVLQRRGRVGRKQVGVFYGLYTEKTFNQLIDVNYPEIYTKDITTVLLNIKASNPSMDLEQLDLMNPPSDTSLQLGLMKLYALGVLDHEKQITQVGQWMNKFMRVSLESIRMILSGLHYRVNLNDLIIIACYLNTNRGDIFRFGFKGFQSMFKDESETHPSIHYFHFNQLKSRLLISCDMIDFLLFYHSFLDYAYETEDIPTITKWCKSVGIHYNGLLQLSDFIDEVTNSLIFDIGINPYAFDVPSIYEELAWSNYMGNDDFIQSVIRIKKCIYEGYKCNILIHQQYIEYQSMLTRQVVYVDSKLVSNIHQQKIGEPIIQTQPKYILYTSLSFLWNDDLKRFIFYTNAPITVLDGFMDVDFTFLES